jgi:bacillithiol system protein YtxJ
MSIEQGTARNPDERFVAVADQDELERRLAASAEQPVVLFKHDYACPISRHAYEQLATVPGEILLIDVERQKALSQEVATRLGITHESPQVIVVRDGQPIYDASRWDITQEDVTRAAGVA